MNFPDLYPLPTFDGLPLAVTATRSLERYGDLVEEGQKPAALAADDRFDLVDECLDLVVPCIERVASYEFTGLSLADFWAAMLQVRGKTPEIERWHAILASDAFEHFREEARKRMGVLAPGCHIASRGYKLPEIYAPLPLVILPEALERLLSTNPEWIKPRRSRWAVEVIEEVGIPGRRLPLRGRHYPKPSQDGLRRWQRWPHLRMQHQAGQPFSEYFELQVCLPSLEESYFNPRSPVRNVFAHLCITRFMGDQPGQVVMLLDDVFSEWLDEYAHQEQGKNLPTRRMVKGREPNSQELLLIPACPVAKDWLDLALGAFIDFAKAQSCSHVAWASGAIHHEIIPEFSLADALVRFDQEVPQTLQRLLGEMAVLSTVDCHTYRRNVLMRHDDEQGCILVGPDGHTRIGDAAEEWDALHQHFLDQAEPITERLPCLSLPLEQNIAELCAPQEADEAFDPGHGSHWDALYDMETVGDEVFVRALENADLIDQYPCVDVAHGSDRAETVYCLRLGNAPLAHDALVVSDSQEDSRFMFSAYPVLLDGIRHRVTLDHFEPWPQGIEAWAHVRVTDAESPVSFFDTRYYAGSAIYQPGQALDVSLAGLAYFLRPIQMRAFDIKEGPLWEMEKQRRLDDGESEQEAARPVTIHMTGGCTFLQLGGRNARDDAQFQGVIDDIRSFEHDGQMIYRLEMEVMRPDDQSFRLSVFASERALDGYVPQLGEDVEGMLWLQGSLLGAADSNTANDQEA